MPSLYDTIGIDYANLRKPDARIAHTITTALGPAATVLNVGAGAGSYEPVGRSVIAIEPSNEMIRQRCASAGSAVRGCAEFLPFGDDTFEASMAVLTVHHWSDQRKGLQEMRRVTQGAVVILTFDPFHSPFWLADYLPELVTLDAGQMPRMTDYETWLGRVEMTPVPIPHDCLDGFLGAYWRRPAAYLNPKIRAAISSFWMVDNVSAAMRKLEEDLKTGVWAQRYAKLLDLETYDIGYRLVVSKR